MLIQLKDTNICQKDKTVLENIEFHVDENEFVYIIGKVGSGKSSLLKTLYGELPLASGSGEILGFDLRKLKRKHIPDLRKQLGIIFQDFQLLADHTVRENLDFVLRATGWKRKAERSQRIDEVLNLVELPEKIDKYPHELSGGEQQRISIARALLKKPKILILDDSTSAVDTKTDAFIRKGFKEFIPNTTKIIIAQRVASVQDADMIIVMENGKIANVGNHNELMNTSEIYREVYNQQTNGGDDNE